MCPNFADDQSDSWARTASNGTIVPIMQFDMVDSAGPVREVPAGDNFRTKKSGQMFTHSVY